MLFAPSVPGGACAARKHLRVLACLLRVSLDGAGFLAVVAALSNRIG